MTSWTKWYYALRARMHLLFRSSAENRMDEEMNFHLAMEADRLIREGVDPAEAQRRAAVAFGGVEAHKEEMREGRTFSFAGGLSLDFRLGLRMLKKYPGITIIGGLAIAFAIFTSAVAFEISDRLLSVKLEIPEEERLISFETWDTRGNRVVPTTAMDYDLWNRELETVERFGAFRLQWRYLSTGAANTQPISTAETNSAALQLSGKSPVLGRQLSPADEAADAAPVVVISEQTWRSAFAADTSVVGTQVRLDGRVHTIVGVLPEIPLYGRTAAWVPLHLNPIQGGGERTRLIVFGKLRPGTTMEQAQAEATALRGASAADDPALQHLEPLIRPLSEFVGGPPRELKIWVTSFNVFLAMLLAIICGNVALLMFARAATRENEMVMRMALGASQRRLMIQLFTEALVLAFVAGAVGLLAANIGVRWAFSILESELLEVPSAVFSTARGLSPATVIYGCLLTLLAAAIAGLIPALKTRTRDLRSNLQRATLGAGGYKFGGIWTAIVIAQLTVTVPFPFFAGGMRSEVMRFATADIGIQMDEYLAMSVELDVTGAETGGQADADVRLAAFGDAYTALEQALEADPNVIGLTFAEALPLRYHEARRIALDAGPSAPVSESLGYRRVSSATVALDFFELFDAPVLEGRSFHSGDLREGASTVIVSQPFVDLVLGGSNPIGRRFRYVEYSQEPDRNAEDETWFEIVGLVRDLGTSINGDPKRAAIYHPAAVGDFVPPEMALRVRSGPEDYIPILNTLAVGIDPRLRLRNMVPYEDLLNYDLRISRVGFYTATTISAIALILSVAGIYSILSFTVAQRTREIGIRIALGARTREIVLPTLRRPLTQGLVGVLLGGALMYPLMTAAGYGNVRFAEFVRAIWGSVALCGCACLLACIVPTRRALRIEPTEALKNTG